MVVPRGLTPFSVKNIVSDSERCSSGGNFFPICDLKSLPDCKFSSADNGDKAYAMCQFAHLWFNSGEDLYLHKCLIGGKYSNLCNIVIIYCFRHCIELCLKSYKMLSGNFDSKMLRSHDIEKLLSEDLKLTFKQYDDEYNCVGNVDVIFDFLVWLRSFEDGNESAYRYAMCGFNPIVDKYVNLELFRDYTAYVLSVIDSYLKSKSDKEFIGISIPLFLPC